MRVALMIVAAASLALSGCKKESEGPAQRPPPTASVVVATAETADIPVTIRTVGNVEPVAQVMLRPQVAGQVVEIPVEEGTEVQAGQTLIVRTAGSPQAIGPALQQATLAIDPLVPRPRISTLEQATAIVLLPQRAAALVTAGLGGVGLLLAAVGLYGIMSYAASRRTREIGIRVAIGARRPEIVRMVLGSGIALALVGIGGGIVLALVMARMLRGLLHGVTPADPATFAAVAVVLTVVAAAASAVPAWRASRVDPVLALKSE